MIRCAECQIENESGGPLADYCQKCGSRLPKVAGTSPQTSASQPVVMTPEQLLTLLQQQSAAHRRNRSHRIKVFFAVVGLAVLGFVLFAIFNPGVNVYVDNGGRDSVAVFVDGKQKLVVPPGEVKSFSCYSGSHHFVVKRGESTIFDETKQVESRGNAGRGNYLINPEATNRYRTKTIQYGMSFPNFQTYYDEEDRVRLIVRNLHLIPPSAWIDEKPDYVLQPAPKSVQGKMLSSREVVERVSKADVDLIDSILARWERQRQDDLRGPADIVARMEWEEKQKQKWSAEKNLIEAAAERISKASP